MLRRDQWLWLTVVTVVSSAIALYGHFNFASDWYEVAAFVTAVVGLYLLVQEIIWNWPILIVSSIVWFWVFLQGKLYADMSLQVFYVVVLFHGWWSWARKGEDKAVIQVSRLQPRYWPWVVLSIIGGTALYVPIVTAIKGSAPFWDSLLTVLSYVGQFMQNRKIFENWPVWVLVNIGYTGLYWYRHLYLATILAVILLGFAVYGWIAWKKPLGRTNSRRRKPKGYTPLPVTASFEHVWSEQGIESWMLSPFGALYTLGWWGYQSIYSLGLKKPFEPHRPVVTVGNLIAGGAGKTPMTLFMASVLSEIGRKVVVSSSGYGFPHAESATLAPDGELTATEWGDEAAMIRMMRPQLPLIVGRDRVQAARIAHEHFPDSVLLLDDGFQHLRLRQHVTLLLAPETRNNFCLPAGPYREPRLTGLSRADLVLPGAEFQVIKGPTIVSQSPDFTIDREVNVLCALARPYQFLESLRSEGYRLATVRCLPDHDPLSAGNLLHGFDLETPLIVTAKDWVKLQEEGILQVGPF